MGLGLIPDGSIPGVMAAVEFGSISPFVEVFRKSGTTTTNLGGNFMLKLPLPMLQPYVAAGGGISQVSASGSPTTSHRMVDLLAGANLNLSGALGVFGQAKYIYTFGSGFDRVRNVAFQVGLLLGL
jgi:hypothetical protein